MAVFTDKIKQVLSWANKQKSGALEVDFVFSDGTDFLFSDGTDFVFKEGSTSVSWSDKNKN